MLNYIFNIIVEMIEDIAGWYIIDYDCSAIVYFFSLLVSPVPQYVRTQRIRESLQ